MAIKTKILLVFGIVAILVLLCAIVIPSILLSYGPTQPLYNITISYQENFSINKNFEFNVGEKYVFKKINYITIMKEDGTKEERIFSTDYEAYSVIGETYNGYIIQHEKNVTLKTMFLGTEIFRTTRYTNNTYVCSKDGDVSTIKTNLNYRNFFANKWMLGLEENKTFKIKITIDNRSYINEFTTVGKEIIDGRKCYKVKMISYSLEDHNYKYLSYYWIDTERRILVKMEEYDGEGNKQHEIVTISSFM